LSTVALTAAAAAVAAARLAFQAFGGLPPNPMRPEVWRPIVQNHFIAAAKPPVPIDSSELLVSLRDVLGGCLRTARA
jgi:hypothetical protein